MRRPAIILILVTTAATSGCCGMRDLTDRERGEVSWRLFCEARGYDPVADAPRQYDEYLEKWCGSPEEEDALIGAGIRPW